MSLSLRLRKICIDQLATNEHNSEKKYENSLLGRSLLLLVVPGGNGALCLDDALEVMIQLWDRDGTQHHRQRSHFIYLQAGSISCCPPGFYDAFSWSIVYIEVYFISQTCSQWWEKRWKQTRKNIHKNNNEKVCRTKEHKHKVVQLPLSGSST